MSNSYLRIVLHTTFSTKFRRPSISPEAEQGMYQLIDSRLRRMGCTVYAINGTLDHVHLLHGLPRDRSLASIIGDLKSISSKWMRARGYGEFLWQRGYASHSVDYRSIERVKRYIANQKQHHYGSKENFARVAIMTFEEEFERLLLHFDMPYEARYLFPQPTAKPAPPPYLRAHAATHPKTDHQYR